MNKNQEFIDVSNPSTTYNFNYELPKICPICNVSVVPTVLSAYLVDIDSINRKAYILFFCHHCEECFLGEYIIVYQEAVSISLSPYKHKDESFSDRISDLSPDFVKIYNQSHHAESIGLDEICGMGYRKALEFLVKDYATVFHPEECDAIQKKQLSACINDYISDKRIKSLAKASNWLGNDETHYVKKHPEYSIKHLKAFMSAIIPYIDSELSYLEAKALLDE